MKVIEYYGDNVYKDNAKNVFEYDGGSWRGFYNELEKTVMYLSDLDFKFEDLDRSMIVVMDDGYIMRLNNGEYRSVCFRCNSCRIWKVTNIDIINAINERI